MTLEMRDQENIELGKEIGREEGREEIVANMLRKNVHIEQIADLCGVDIKEVLEIQQKMQL